MIPQIEGFSYELALKYLAAPDFGFDVETDARNYHWGKEDGDEEKTDRKRGLSYVADMSYISFYADSLPMLVLIAVPTQIDFTAEVVEEGKIEERPYQRFKYSFTDDEVEFVYQMFMRDRPYTAIAHNLVFDARQIISKILHNEPLPATATLWDTSTVNLLGRWRPIMHDKDAISLAVLEGHYKILEPSWRTWWGEMKTFRNKLHLLGEDTAEGTKYRKNLKRYLLPPNIAGEEREGKGWSLEEGQNAARIYSGLDSYVAYQVYCRQLAEPRYTVTPSPRFPYSETFETMLRTDLEYTKWCAQACAKGIKFNVDYVRQQRQQFLSELVGKAKELGFEPKEAFIPRGRDWQQAYIFKIVPKPTSDEISKHPYLLTPKGAYSASAPALEYYIQTYPELKTLKEYFEANTKFTRTDEFLRHAELDGRIHSDIDRFTITGRSSASTPNLMNLHMAVNARTGEEIGDTNAGYLIADEDFCLVELDYSNAENWFQAMLSGDNVLALACAQFDFHSANAERYFPDKWAQADAPMRKWLRTISKPATFAIPYGTGAKKLSKSLSVETGEIFTIQQAQEIIDARNLAYEAAANAQKKAGEASDKTGFTRLWTGRQVSITQYERHYKGYTAWNSLCQGGVGEMVVRAILQINRWLIDNDYRTRVILQIHDSIIVHMAIDEFDEVTPHIIQIMSGIMPPAWNNRTNPAIRWLTDVEHGSNAKKWGYVPGQEYPWPLDEYVNQWGTHKLEPGQKERPVWINEFGWGDRALNIERGRQVPDEEFYENIVEAKNFEDVPFDWEAFKVVFDGARDFVKMYYHGKGAFNFSEAMELHRALCHRGQENQWEAIIAAFDRLSGQMVKYREWRSLGGGKC